MDKKIVINGAEDFFRIFKDKYGFLETNTGMEYQYIVNEEYGVGQMNRFSMRNGVEINLCDICLKDSIKLFYKLEGLFFEVIYCMTGHIDYFQKSIGEKTLHAHQYGIVMKNGAEGWMSFPEKTRIKYIAIASYTPFIEVFTRGSDNFDSSNSTLDEKSIDALMEPKAIYPLLKNKFWQLDHCGDHGINRLIDVESKAMAVIATALRHDILKERKVSTKLYLSIGDRERIFRAAKILENNLCEPIAIKELAMLTELNEFKLKNGFKQVFGLTLYGYIKEKRLEKAKGILESTDSNINEIVNEVGYANTGHFAKAFREKYGVNPKDLRASCRNMK